MSTITSDNAAAGGIEVRILREGYGEGAWHGPDLKAALADVTSPIAFWRPAPERHNIAEVALHHAYCVRGVRAKITGVDAAPFILEGDDWFAIPGPATLSWSKILEVVRLEQEHLASAVADVHAGRARSPLAEAERFDLALGIACHAVYHAGQIQLLKRLAAADS